MVRRSVGSHPASVSETFGLGLSARGRSPGGRQIVAVMAEEPEH